MKYQEFLTNKEIVDQNSGFEIDVKDLNPKLFDFQKAIVKWALMRGRAAVFLPCGSGKCHGKDTKILMYNGGIKNVQDIKIGEKLMGNDSTPREVLSLAHGVDMLYKIKLINGDSFTCNSSHILSLIMSNEYYGHQKGEILNISIPEYLNLPQYVKRNTYKSYKASVIFPFKEVDFDSYLYGLWLGDGSKACLDFTINDKDIEIVQYLKKYALDNNFYIREVGGHGCKTYCLTHGLGFNKKYFQKEFLKKSYVREKRINQDYLINDKETRLKVLAGLLDTDGYLKDNCYEIVTKFIGLRDDILFLCRSLGFRVSHKIKNVKGTDYYRICISGNTHLIPCITRKKASIRRQIKNPLVYGFTIEELGVGDYYGFEISGNHLYLLGDFTVTHNTWIQLSFAHEVYKKTKGKILVLAPLAVTYQTKQESEKLGIKINVCESNKDVKDGINITNYEKLGKYNCSIFDGIVLDECFTPDTLIDVFSIDNELKTEYIKNISIGCKILNAGGIDYVQKISKKRIERAVKININGRNITCSENHPFFTMYGWKCAQNIQAGDYLMEARSAMCLVRKDIQTEVHMSENAKILQSILLSELEDECSRDLCKSTYKGGACKDRKKSKYMEEIWKSCCIEGDGENSKFKSNDKFRKQEKTIIEITGNETQTFRAWWKWSRDDIASAINERCIVRELDTGICYITGETSTRFSDMLQSRLGESRVKNSDRNRRDESPFQKMFGQEKGSEIKYFRVESVEILEQGHPELEKYRDEDGFIYFYDIKAKRHPSFSVNSILVHNSSCLKSFTSFTRNQILELFKNTSYRLACSATPSPNDYEELGNHSEFLGIMTRMEMLASFFINDTANTGTWRLKGHVKDNLFWKWMSSWSVMFNTPSDIGFSDEGYVLPKLHYHEHILKPEGKPKRGLFHIEAKTLNDRRRVRKETIKVRSDEAAKLINSSNEKWIIWAGLNDEGDYLEKVINGSVQVAGRHTDEIKSKRMLDFANGKIEKLVTKALIAGWGLNFQVCHNAAYIGLSDSFELLYQSVRRIWRYGQTSEVHIHFFLEEREGSVLQNLKRKDKQATEMIQNMIRYMKDLTKQQLQQASNEQEEYNPQIEMRIPIWLRSGNA
jgi:hypothetical protein